ncbi:MAG: hypothetical protein KDB27_18780 [Planctomycetales bacterium]|nr:hypothetical protein [Planctomycetales bacterium]
MSVSLLEERQISPQAPNRTPVIVQSVEPKEPRLRLANQSITSDEEIAFVYRAVMWMLFLSVTPLIVFLIVNYFHPELFLTPIAPN